MVESERISLGTWQPAPIVECCLQQGEGADDIGLDESRWPVDRAIDMAFRGEVHDRVRRKTLDYGVHLCGVDNVSTHKRVAGVLRDCSQSF